LEKAGKHCRIIWPETSETITIGCSIAKILPADDGGDNPDTLGIVMLQINKLLHGKIAFVNQ
jgi:hypothetical protein